ncbi:MAG: hypothetical protein LQ338_006848, partial [Usnochroma carphineum]
ESTSTTPAELTSSPSTEPPPGKPLRKQLTRDQRLQIHTLRKAGHSHEFIVDFFKPEKVTYRQVAYACTQPIDPQNHRSGAKPKLDAETRRQVKELMEKSAGPRPITYKEVSAQLGLEGISESTLRRARYEDDPSTAGPYQYEKNKTIKAPSKKRDRKQSDAGRRAGPAAPPAVNRSKNHPPASDISDLAASWTAFPQHFIPNKGPQPA